MRGRCNEGEESPSEAAGDVTLVVEGPLDVPMWLVETPEMFTGPVNRLPCGGGAAAEGEEAEGEEQGAGRADVPAAVVGKVGCM